jgi:hypothetical protein
MSLFINYKDLIIKLNIYNNLITNIIITNKNLRLIYNIIIIKKIIILFKS